MVGNSTKEAAAKKSGLFEALVRAAAALNARLRQAFTSERQFQPIWQTDANQLPGMPCASPQYPRSNPWR